MAVVTRRQQFLVGHASAAPGCSAVFVDGAYCNASKATPLMSTVSPIPPERALIHHDGREHAAAPSAVSCVPLTPSPESMSMAAGS